MDERYIFEFVKPLSGHISGPWSRWHLQVGGWEISGNNKQELRGIAITLLERELKRLEKLEKEK